MRFVFSAFWRPLELKEKRFLLAVIALHLLAITLPYFWASTITPNGYSYGGLLFSPDDANVHLAWARQAADGHFFTRDLFTTESLDSHEKPLFFNALCGVMGLLARIGIPLVFGYHLLRVVFAVVALLAFYALARRLLTRMRDRYLALLFVAFGLGAGYLMPLLPGRIFIDRPDGNFPMMPEAFFFSSSFLFTLNVAALALLLLLHLCALGAPELEDGARRKKAVALGFVGAALLSNIHTYDAIPLLITLAAATLVTKSPAPMRRRLIVTGALIVGALLPLFYQLIVFRGSEEFRIKALTPTPAPPPLDLLLSYGVLVPLAVFGMIAVWKMVDASRRAVGLWLCLWMLVTLVSAYLPVSFARKMLEGFHLPLCLLAALGLGWLLDRLASRPIRLVIAGASMVLVCASAVQLWTWCTLENTQNPQDYNASRGPLMPPLYLTSGDLSALEFLNTQVPPADKATAAVLCWGKLGNYVPRETGMYTYFGHWAETLNVESKDGHPGKFSQVLDFFSGKMTAEQAKAWLAANHIGYVIVGHYEKNGLPLHLPLVLKMLHEDGGTVVYGVE